MYACLTLLLRKGFVIFHQSVKGTSTRVVWFGNYWSLHYPSVRDGSVVSVPVGLSVWPCSGLFVCESVCLSGWLDTVCLSVEVSWPSGLVYWTQVLVLSECGFESRPGRSRRLCP